MDYATWAKFVILLLERLKLRRKEPPPQIPPPPVRPVAILLVEDDPDEGFLAHRTITGAGYVCDWVESCEHALILTAKVTYRLMIIDIGMHGGMNGYELARQVRRDHPRVPIWLWTGSKDNLFCVEEGFPVGILLKTTRWEDLLDAIRMTA